MKTLVSIALLVTLSVSIAGCDNNAAAPKADVSADPMGEMAVPAEAVMANGTGTVATIDAAAGRITLNHDPIAELEWPAMTMGFSVEADKLEGIAVGDVVSFDLQWDGRAGKVTSITKGE